MKQYPAFAESDVDEGEQLCRTCRYCIGRWEHGDVKGTWHRWCTLRNTRKLEPCPGFEREPGTEGDDD